MKKHDFKKLALLGLAAGSLVASNAVVAFEASNSETFLAAGCGSKCSNKRAGCGHQNQPVAEADEEVPQTTQNSVYQNKPAANGTTTTSGCGSKSNPNAGNSNGGGCGSKSNPNAGNSNGGGCGAKPNPTTNGSRSGCGAKPNTTTNQGYLACGCDDEESDV